MQMNKMLFAIEVFEKMRLPKKLKIMTEKKKKHKKQKRKRKIKFAIQNAHLINAIDMPLPLMSLIFFESKKDFNAFFFKTSENYFVFNSLKFY